MTNLDNAKKVAKDNGVKGFKKLKLKREIYHVGKQCARISTPVALDMIAKFEVLGFRITERSTTLEVAEKGLLDIISIEK